MCVGSPASGSLTGNDGRTFSACGHGRTLVGIRRLTVVAGAALMLTDASSRAACLDCHGVPGFSAPDSSGTQVALHVDPAVLAGSIHGSLQCTDCHTGAGQIPHPARMAPVACDGCHADVAAAYRYHGFRREEPGALDPACRDCHGTHDILPAADPRSSTHPDRLPVTCGRCHENQAVVGRYHIAMTAPVRQYEASVHSRASRAGGAPVATCIDCHSAGGTAHAILAPIDPQSTINRFNIARTCGRCHSRIATDYARGVHGQAAARGEPDTPVCTDCHGAHAILPVADPASRVSPTRVSLSVCAPCHENEQLNVKYGLPTGIMKSWRHSYHGLKSTDGDPRVANCASCHRAHLILPASDPASSISPSRVQTTCARCHRSISPQLARIEIHRTNGIFLNATGRAFRSIYIVAIVVIIGLMVIHWLVDLSKRIRVLNRGEQVVRMQRNELWQHTLLMVTFTVLTITGFAFHYSGSWWARWLFGWPGGFVLRRVIHLVAAVVFTGAAVWHLVYLGTARGRRFLKDVFPRGRDFRQFFETMGYDLDLRPERPRFGRFSYIEKAEYWALVWGAVVMAVTGFALWFGTTTESLLKVGALGVMLIVHFYEAVLAGLAILIWHLYSTIFNPPVYPNNPSWYTGRMPRDVYREEHADDPLPGTTPEAEAPPPPPSAPDAGDEATDAIEPGSGSYAQAEPDAAAPPSSEPGGPGGTQEAGPAAERPIEPAADDRPPAPGGEG